ncbi:MAG: L-allo-threonine aldolase [Desulfobacterales bacterium RIFOXYA12_FULL_46_15]|nr:MAG: L-allo-threonine aldolase [Desulfobacula sp. GWF2_41_7]OGR28168.1 MAG: L-allo-threonine aldolase [Desulfobacterales bacterium RIFOXYA12_FULL_46_15]
MKPIDLRSDTVTKPCVEMRRAMMNAAVGDDVYGEDPTVNRLESLAAEMLGTKAALFCTSGTQSNLLALMAHCERGDEYIVGQYAHTYRYEGGGAAVLGSIQPQPLDFEKDGTLSLEKVSGAIKPDDHHYARTKLLCLENTHMGKVLPLPYLKAAKELAGDKALKMHLDGARVFNASVKLGVDVKDITRYFDTISCCLSKGLGAPVGSVLCGSAENIEKARRWRKLLGGGMRQAGILAAAGIYALTHNIERLKDDHGNAMALAKGLAQIESITVDLQSVRTNIFFADIKADMSRLYSFLKERGVIIDTSAHLRLVTHLDISDEDIDYTIGAFKQFFQ